MGSLDDGRGPQRNIEKQTITPTEGRNTNKGGTSL